MSEDPHGDSEFTTCEYMGQHCGWHFYVVELAEHRAQFTAAVLPGGIFYGVAIPPVDGKPYTTAENIRPPDPAAAGGVPGTLQLVGGSKAEAIYKAVGEMLELHSEKAGREC
jgi:hypothetical protein